MNNSNIIRLRSTVQWENHFVVRLYMRFCGGFKEITTYVIPLLRLILCRFPFSFLFSFSQEIRISREVFIIVWTKKKKKKNWIQRHPRSLMYHSFVIRFLYRNLSDLTPRIAWVRLYKHDIIICVAFTSTNKFHLVSFRKADRFQHAVEELVYHLIIISVNTTLTVAVES